jgi:hypothetical protein
MKNNILLIVYLSSHLQQQQQQQQKKNNFSIYFNEIVTNTKSNSLEKVLIEPEYTISNDDYHDLNRFLNYLLYNNDEQSKFLNSSNITKNKNNLNVNDDYLDEYGFYYYLPAALVQLFIIVVVFLIVLFMCKCNKLMESCRNCTNSSNSSVKSDESIYNDKMTLTDYLCYSCYRYKMKRRFKKRRIRNKRFNRIRLNAKNASGKMLVNADGSVSRRTGGYQSINRNNSLIRRRNSIVHKNRVYSTSLKRMKNNVNSVSMSSSQTVRSRPLKRQFSVWEQNSVSSSTFNESINLSSKTSQPEFL